MTKYTLGPWYAAYSKTNDFSGGNIRSDHHRDGEAALLFRTGPMFHNYTPDREEELANLWLVAVAPELLEALEQYDNFAKANDDWRDGDEPPVDFVVRARQIIAQLKGENDGNPCL